MATIKTYSDLQQSKKLAEILPPESADFCWGLDDETLQYNNSPYPCAWNDYTCKEYYIPCWSLAALLGVLPKGTNISTPKSINALSYCCWNQYDEIYADNPVDACYEMIIRLHEQKLL